MNGSRKLALRTALAMVGGMIVALALASPASSQPGVAPKASFTAAPNPAQPGETVAFDGSGSTGDGQGSSITRYEWDLDGDGDFEINAGTAPTVLRAYPSPRTTTVRLRVTDSEADIAEASMAVRVNAAPIAAFIYEPAPPVAEERVVFSSITGDPDGAIPPSGYSWDFDEDGKFDDAFGETVTVSFPKAGMRKVKLRVVDADGSVDTAARKVRVLPAQPDQRVLSPFPIVELEGKVTSEGATKIEQLSVEGPAGSKVTVRCRGQSCPFDDRARSIRRSRVTFPAIERRLLPGVVIEIYVTEPRRIGKFTRFKLRDGKVPKRKDACVKSGSRRPIDCPR